MSDPKFKKGEKVHTDVGIGPIIEFDEECNMYWVKGCGWFGGEDLKRVRRRAKNRERGKERA